MRLAALVLSIAYGSALLPSPVRAELRTARLAVGSAEIVADTTPSTPAHTAPPVVYLIDRNSDTPTNALSSVTTQVLQDAVEVANRYQIATIVLSTKFDSSAPENSCNGADGKTPAVRPQDILITINVAQADQVSNKFTGADTQNVKLELERIDCPKVSSSGVQPHALPPLPSGAPSAFHYAGYFGEAHGTYWWDPISGLAAVVALLTSPWINTYRLWLAAPATVVDSFKNEARALSGTIYCATTSGMLQALQANHMIQLKKEQGALTAYRLDYPNNAQYKVPGVNYCGAQQPVRPALDDPAIQMTINNAYKFGTPIDPNGGDQNAGSP
jgi:hypothetical protein